MQYFLSSMILGLSGSHTCSLVQWLVSPPGCKTYHFTTFEFDHCGCCWIFGTIVIEVSNLTTLFLNLSLSTFLLTLCHSLVLLNKYINANPLSSVECIHDSMQVRFLIFISSTVLFPSIEQLPWNHDVFKVVWHAKCSERWFKAEVWIVDWWNCQIINDWLHPFCLIIWIANCLSVVALEGGLLHFWNDIL